MNLGHNRVLLTMEEENYVQIQNPELVVQRGIFYADSKEEQL